MSQKTREQQAKQRAQRKQKQIVIAVVIIAVLIAAAVVLMNVMQPKPTPSLALELSPGADGALTVPVDALAENGLTYIDYGGDIDLLVWTADNGNLRAAFDTCEECFTGSSIRYTLNGGTLTCGACGNTMSASEMGLASWGGCQPVSIPVSMRADTEEAIVIPGGVFAYAHEVFAEWSEENFERTLGDYAA